MNTFKELYNFLRTYKGDTIIPWLGERWEGKDKQESLLRLFAGLDLIEKLKDFKVCKGNFNKMEIKIIQSYKEIFENNFFNDINLKDSSDSSDLTCISKQNPKNVLATTSKNLNDNNMHINDLDIYPIIKNFDKYEKHGYDITLCICIRSRIIYNKMKKNIRDTSQDLIDIINRPNGIVIDWFDLDQAFQKFKVVFSNKDLDTIIKTKKQPLLLKLHQELSVQKTIKLKKTVKITYYGVMFKEAVKVIL